MCGIAGIVQTNERRLDAGLLEAMTGSLAHRGPDGEGYVLLARGGREKPFAVAGKLSQAVRTDQGLGPYRIGLGHRRLAVVDLSPLGHQPMGSDDGAQWITYNGEVYNAPELRRELTALGHRFRSSSDTEVVLAAYRQWGQGCLARFNGMFAFALWDGLEQELFCARDRFGIKPFYYRQEGSRLLFASEIKALLQDRSYKAKPNDRIVYDYLAFSRQDHTGETFFQDVRQLAPGEWMKIKPGEGSGGLKIERERWWRFPLDIGKQMLSLEDAAARTRELLEDAVRLELRADVPVGSCLSGGLDSSSIVCLMSALLRGQSRPRTFSSCHEDERFDERRYIRQVLERTGAGNEEVFPDAARLYEDLPRLLWHQEEPFAGTSIMAQWAVMGAAGRSGMKVLLDGQGADELLFGYPGFMGSRLADLIKTGKWGRGLREWQAWRDIHAGLQPTAWAGLVRGLVPAGLAAGLRRWNLGDDQWLDPGFAGTWSQMGREGALKRGSVLQTHMERAVTGDLPALLHYEDRNAMAFSIEARAPFLDHRLVEWLAVMPPELKLRRGMTKVVLREAMSGILPEEVRLRRDKMGFVTPQDQWLRVELRPQIEALFKSESFNSRPYWKAERIREWYGRYCSGRAEVGPTVWRWVNLECWLRRFCD
jgi:asparagine synthase (glutamine-hydrolysing)